MKRLGLYFLLVLAPVLSNAQVQLQPVFDHIEPETFGVTSMGGQNWDQEGGMWMVCNKGILYYNGYSHRIWGKLPGDTSKIAGNILSFYLDKKDRLWFSYRNRGGITCFDPKKNSIIHYRPDSSDLQHSIPEVAVVTYVEDSKGRFWVLTWGGGLMQLNEKTGKFTIYQRDNTQPKKPTAPVCNFVKDMDELPDGRFLVSYFANNNIGGPPEYFDVEKGTFTPLAIETFSTESALERERITGSSTIVHASYFDRFGNLWVATYSGLNYFDLKHKTARRVSGRAFDGTLGNLENTRGILEGDNGLLWVPTVNSGIMVVNPQTFEVGYIQQNSGSESGLSDNLVTNVKKDPKGNIWVGTSSGTLNIYQPLRQQFNIINWDLLNLEYSNRSGQMVPLTDMHIGEDGIVYMSSNNGISVYDINQRKLLEMVVPKGEKIISENNFSRARVGWFKITDRYILMQAPVALKLFDRKTKQYTDLKHTEWMPILSRTQRDDGQFLLKGHRHEILQYHFNKKSFDTLAVIPNRMEIQGYHSFKLPGNRYVISGNNKGFVVLDMNTKKIDFYGSDTTANIAFPATEINSFYPGEKDQLWVCTEKGLYRTDLKTGQSTWMNHLLGMKEDEGILYMIWDGNKYYWMCGNKQLIRFDPVENKIFRFTSDLGVKAGNFVTPLPERDPSGRLYFATTKGLLVIRPENIRIPAEVPRVSLYALTIKEDTLDQERLAQFANGRMSLSHHQNFLNLEFSTNEVFTPVPHHFYYRLIGLDSTWQDNGVSNRVRYTNLSYGKYVLEVRCINAYGVQSHVLKIPFEIKRPFWLAWWFYVMVLLVLVTAVWLIISIREKALRRQREILERKVALRTAEVVEKAREITLQKEIIEEKNKELTDSIYYAQRIQQSILPDPGQIGKHLPEHFIFFKPKDIVSGDFYWYSAQKDSVLVAVVDCTGHGVPGGFMSMLGAGLLNQIVNEEFRLDPAEVLNQLRDRVIMALKQTGAEGENRDGMDISICRIIPSAGKIEFAGANNPLYLLRNGELQEIRADKQPIGIHVGEKTPFTRQDIVLQPNDQIYLSSDGYADQFGGEKGKKFKTSNFEKLLLKIGHFNMRQQERELDSTFAQWKGDYEQVDDICVVGIKL